MDWVSALIGGASSLIGGLISDRSNRKATQQAIAYDHYVRTHNIQNIVKDARAAGINPLAALGVTNTGSSITPVGQSAFGDAIAEGGSQLARAFSEEMQLSKERARADIAKIRAEEELLKAQSRTLLANARAKAQSLDSAEVASGKLPDMGVIGKNKPSFMKAPADEVQREFDDAVSSVYGLMRWWDTFRSPPPKVYKWSDGKYRTHPEPKGR